MLFVVLALVLLSLLVAVLWILLVQVLKQHGRLLLRLETLEYVSGVQQDLDQSIPVPSASDLATPNGESLPGLPSGTVLQDFALPTLDGDTMVFSQWRGRRVLLIFFDPRSAFCRHMLPGLAALSTTGEVTPLVLSTGSVEENRTLFARYGLSLTVLLQKQGEVAELYNVSGTPWAYLVDEQGCTVGAPAIGSEAVLALAAAPGLKPTAEAGVTPPPYRITRNLAGSHLIRDGLAPGTPAPYFRLPRLDGGEISLDDYRGRELLLTFSDPACGPCNEVVTDLQAMQHHSNAPSILIISRGEVAANRAKVLEHGLTFPVVLQRHWEISRDYGMFATPIGYLIDQHGIIAAHVAVGRDAILALLQSDVRV